MKILHLSTHDCGGAGMAALRFHKNLKARGIDSRMLVLSKHTEDPDVIPVNKPNYFSQAYRLASRALLKIRSNPDYYFQDQTKSALNNSNDCFNKIDFHPDIIVAHGISNFASLEEMYQMSARENVPVIWYLMDMAPITGGCHYAWDCTGYMNQCGNCPALYSSNASDMSSRTWKKKHAYIQRMNMTVVSGGWLIDQAGKATLFNGKRREKIIVGVDADVFKPHSRADIRKALDLPIDKKIIFIGSQGMKVRRKGMKYFVEAVGILEQTKEVDKDSIIIMTAGDIAAKTSLRGTVFRHIHLGFLDESGLVKAYQAADVFVCPSIEDSGPMMIVESVMCGTPVVAFEMGLSVDLVHTKVTGYRATLKDSNDLARGIMQVLNLNLADAQKMSSNCRDIGMKLASDEAQVNAFVSLFDEIIAGNNA